VTPTDPNDGGPDDDTGDGDDTNTESDGLGTLPIILALLVLLGAGGIVVWYTVFRSAEESIASTETDPSTDAEGAKAAGDLETKELLSDEDHVLKLLEENGGRMRQVSIVEETEWSKSKVSMLLSDMEDEGDISKLRVGRENIISLAGEEPEAAGSPFEDEKE
jgi:uncharacterized membrane protein